MNPLKKLSELGQYYWLDNLTRDMMNSGELQRRISEQDLGGITSNPNTFGKAIADSDAYNDDVSDYLSEGLAPATILRKLMMADVQRACDLLAPVYEASAGFNGYVSIEVDPRLARHTDLTLDAARELHEGVDRPNCYVKIPGTPEGLPAIEEALYEGIKVNITLLFSVERYREVALAYQRAMRRRLDNQLPIDQMHSVASFFLSRIDVLVDGLLDHRITPGDDVAQSDIGQMKGWTALYEARRAYAAFEDLFNQTDWKKMQEEHGGNIQQPLWASTGSKNPAYSDTLYVDSLVAKQTVTTMPESTIEAFAGQGTAKEDAIYDLVTGAADQHRHRLAQLGIPFDYISQRLEDEGIQKFIDPQDQALKIIRESEKVPA